MGIDFKTELFNGEGNSLTACCTFDRGRVKLVMRDM